MNSGRQCLFRKDNLAPSEVRRIEAARKLAQCDGRKKRQRFQSIQQIEVGAIWAVLRFHLLLLLFARVDSVSYGDQRKDHAILRGCEVIFREA
jgi:hypothetical protein